VTNPQGPPHQDTSSPWARPGDPSSPTQPGPQAELPYPPPVQDYPTAAAFDQPPPDGPAEPVKPERRFRLLADPVSIVLVLVIVAALTAAGLVGGELYARHRADSVVAAATSCVTKDRTKRVSFGPVPFLWQHLTGHYQDISIETGGARIRNAVGMAAVINIDDVDLHGSGDSKGTIGKLDADITWTSDGIRETVQDSLPFIGGLVNSVTTDPGAGTIELTGAMGLGGVTVKPQVADGQLTLQVSKVNALGVLIPHETAQTALNAFTAALLKQYPLGIKADSVQVTNDGVSAHFSSRNASIPAAQSNPCFAHV
jgi:hypothetical protein